MTDPFQIRKRKGKDFWSTRKTEDSCLKEHFDNTCFESNVLPLKLSKKQCCIEKSQIYIASLKNKSTLDQLHFKYFSETVCPRKRTFWTENCLKLSEGIKYSQ